MPDIAAISPSVVALPKASADGPKYNEDVTLLEEGNVDDSSDVSAPDEDKDDKPVKVTLPRKDTEDEEDEDKTDEEEEDVDAESAKPVDHSF